MKQRCCKCQFYKDEAAFAKDSELCYNCALEVRREARETSIEPVNLIHKFISQSIDNTDIPLTATPVTKLAPLAPKTSLDHVLKVIEAYERVKALKLDPERENYLQELIYNAIKGRQAELNDSNATTKLVISSDIELSLLEWLQNLGYECSSPGILKGFGKTVAASYRSQFKRKPNNTSKGAVYPESAKSLIATLAANYSKSTGYIKLVRNSSD
jgi:hypothetical protein